MGVQDGTIFLGATGPRGPLTASSLISRPRHLADPCRPRVRSYFSYVGFVRRTFCIQHHAHSRIRIPAYQPIEEEKPATPKQATMVGARGNSIGRRYVPSAPPHGTPSPSFSSSPPYVPSSSPASCARVAGLALPQQQQSQQSHFRRCVATLPAAMPLFTNPMLFYHSSSSRNPF